MIENDDNSTNPFIHEESGRPNKTALKRHMEELQQLAETLLTLSREVFNTMPLDTETLREFDIIRGMQHREARKRQIRHIAKRLAESDIDGIKALLAAQAVKTRTFRQTHQQAEQWQQRLLNDGNGALSEFVDTHPTEEIQRLRQLIRQSQKEYAAGSHGNNSKKLFQFICQVIEQ